ncbi:DUF1810 domain-containing protein [Pedobacter sp. UYP1]|jgi:uncharacterized protein (DUF1810 family)|uniref:DUF1810 domain-containing protein n=1 Tax=Pedobacter sp. UYP1 TaxID=1756396 RepID=UPI003392809F
MKPHDLERFITAQKGVFQTALGEIQNGKKITHWMWYIFPQIQGLGFTENSKYYGIKDLQEATEFLQHRVLGPRLILTCNTLLSLETNDAHQVFSSPDDLKLKSCMTLFSEIPDSNPVFDKVLKKFFNGLKDHITLKILNLHR